MSELFEDRNADDPHDPLSEAYTGPQEVVTEPAPGAAPSQEAPPAPAPAAPEAAPSPEAGAAQSENADVDPARAGEPAAPAEGETPAEAAKRWAGRFNTPEELERNYAEQSTWARQAAERANSAERELGELRTAVQQYVAQQQASPQRQAQAAPAVPEPSDEQLMQWGIDRAAYQAIKAPIEQQMQARLAPIEQHLQAQQQQTYAQQQAQAAQAQQQAEIARDQNEARYALSEFVTIHPDFGAGTENLAKLDGLIRDWNDAWTQIDGSSFEYASTNAYEIAREALARPVLAQVLKVNPSWLDTDAGMEMARNQATLYEAMSPATTQTPGAAQVPGSPHVESGPNGARSAPSGAPATPGDPMDDVIALDKTLRASHSFGH